MGQLLRGCLYALVDRLSVAVSIMAIKDMTPSLSLVLYFDLMFHSDVITQDIGGVIGHIFIISDNFLLQDFYFFSCIIPYSLGFKQHHLSKDTFCCLNPKKGIQPGMCVCLRHIGY